MIGITVMGLTPKVNDYPLNYVMFPLNILAPVCLFVKKEEKTSRIFLEDWDVVMCAPSEWLSGLHNYSEENLNSFVIGRLELFYSRNPERVPDAVFVGSGYEDIRDWYIAQYGLQIQDEGQYGTILVRKEV